MNLRPIRWPDDAAQLERFDASYRTTTILRPEIVGLSAHLREVQLPTPFIKVYGAETLVEAVTTASFAVAAVSAGGAIEGFTAARRTAWNRGAELTALFVAPDRRGRGVGRALLAAAVAFAREAQARCLHVETQSCNVPAIRFYERAGFRFCGLHTALYDPATVAPDEVALFFTRSLADP